jgi:hypothetical protein
VAVAIAQTLSLASFSVVTSMEATQMVAPDWTVFARAVIEVPLAGARKLALRAV